jgi:hypothetical protein
VEALPRADGEQREEGGEQRQHDRSEQRRLPDGEEERPDGERADRAHEHGECDPLDGSQAHVERRALVLVLLERAILVLVTETNYSSGHDYVVEFLGYRFAFSAGDFEERVTAAAVKLGLVGGNELDAEETADLVELAADGRIDEPRSALGAYLVRHWERLSIVKGESLVYWIRKLVFRGAWLDHRVKEGLLEVSWDDVVADFAYRDPRGGRALLELAPVPSWHALQFRR